jgi:hypothetical protein
VGRGGDRGSHAGSGESALMVRTALHDFEMANRLDVVPVRI